MARKKITPREYSEVTTGVRLSSHEKLCAERMNNILKSIERLEKKVEQLSDNVSTGKGIVKVLVVLGSLAAGIIGYFNFK
tara:strand:+ start:39 stop:278 length:240 start_codon:yes stop_codon:yes gene_type:complete